MLSDGFELLSTRTVELSLTGFCNLGFIFAKERKLITDAGVDIDFVVTPSNQDIATLFGAGNVDMSMIP